MGSYALILLSALVLQLLCAHAIVSQTSSSNFLKGLEVTCSWKERKCLFRGLLLDPKSRKCVYAGKECTYTKNNQIYNGRFVALSNQPLAKCKQEMLCDEDKIHMTDGGCLRIEDACPSKGQHLAWHPFGSWECVSNENHQGSQSLEGGSTIPMTNEDASGNEEQENQNLVRHPRNTGRDGRERTQEGENEGEENGRGQRHGCVISPDRSRNHRHHRHHGRRRVCGCAGRREDDDADRSEDSGRGCRCGRRRGCGCGGRGRGGGTDNQDSGANEISDEDDRPVNSERSKRSTCLSGCANQQPRTNGNGYGYGYSDGNGGFGYGYSTGNGGGGGGGSTSGGGYGYGGGYGGGGDYGGYGGRRKRDAPMGTNTGNGSNTCVIGRILREVYPKKL